MDKKKVKELIEQAIIWKWLDTEFFIIKFK